MKWKTRKDFSVYCGSYWNPVPLAYTAPEKIKGMTVVAHRRVGEKANQECWDISEETSRLRITNDRSKTRHQAWEHAVDRCKNFTEEYLADSVAKNTAMQVLKTLKGE